MTDTVSNDPSQFPQTMPISGTPASAPTPAPAAPTERAGDEFGPYRLVSVLGEGGFGSVWLAERRQPFLLRVALKIIKPGMDSKAVIARFEQERQTLAVMNHPNVARVLDGGLSAGGRPYFAMEFVKGQPITDFCNEHKLPLTARLRLFIQVCEAVQHAHTKGIIHRDLKPGNILVTRAEGDEPHAKVIDFGVAKALTQGDEDELIASEAGSMVGTPEYMSPEQAESDADQIDTRSDVFSLGVILYELLCGLLPFDSGELRSRTYREIQRTIREVTPPTASARLSAAIAADATLGTRVGAARGTSVGAVLRLLQQELDWIPSKATQKEPRHRYQTAMALVDDIRNYLEGRALDAAPDAPMYRLRKYVRRNIGLVLASAAVLLALVTGLGLATWQWREAAMARNAAEASEAAAIEQRNMAEAARMEATRAKESAQASEARAIEEKEAADAARRRVEEAAYLANVQMAAAWLDAEDPLRLRERLDACDPRRQDWEWGWLQANADASLAALPTPGTSVATACFSPDGLRVLSVAADGTGRLWDARTGEPIAALSGHRGLVYSAHFRAAGDLCVTASQDGTARLWDGLSGQPVRSLEGHQAPVFSAEFSRDGRRVVTASADGTARIWETDSGTMLGELKGHEGEVATAVFDPAGRRVATASLDGSVRLWDAASMSPLLRLDLGGSQGVWAGFDASGSRVMGIAANGSARVWDAASGELRHELRGHRDRLVAAAFGPAGDQVATASADGTARLWALGDKPTSVELAGHTRPLTSLIWSGDGRTLVTTSMDGTARVWDAATGSMLGVLRGHTGPVFACSERPDGQRIVTASADGTARIWPAIPAETALSIPAHRGIAFAVAASPDGSTALSTGEDGTAVLWDLATHEPIARLQGHGRTIADAAFSPDGSLVVTAGDDGTARLWKSSHGTPVATLKGHAGPVRSVAFSSDGTRVATGSHDGSAGIWNLAGERIANLAGGDRVLDVAFSPDGSRVITAGRDGKARLWAIQDGGLQRELAGHEGPIVSVMFNRSGDRVLTASSDGTARIWDADSGSPPLVLKGHDGPVNAAAFSPDDTRVVTTSRDRTARLWNAVDGRPVATLQGHTENVLRVAFTPEGQRLATASVDGTCRIWDAATGAQLVQLAGPGQAITSCAFTGDGTRLLASGAEGAVLEWDAVPPRVRFAESQFRLQGRPDPLGPLVRTEARGQTSSSWVTDPSVTRNRPNFQVGPSASLAPRRVETLLRDAITRKRIEAALLAARRWGTEGLSPAVLNSMAWQGATELAIDHPQRDLDLLKSCAERAVAATDRREAGYLDTLARVLWERGERQAAVTVQREAIGLVDATPEPADARAAERRVALRASMQAALDRYEGAPAATATP
jgi:WD40 repeat protein/serine/threonine protein kinase